MFLVFQHSMVVHLDVNADLDGASNTELDDVNGNSSKASTFAGNIDANGDLDVDGRTELDITNISETFKRYWHYYI